MFPMGRDRGLPPLPHQSIFLSYPGPSPLPCVYCRRPSLFLATAAGPPRGEGSWTRRRSFLSYRFLLIWKFLSSFFSSHPPPLYVCPRAAFFFSRFCSETRDCSFARQAGALLLLRCCGVGAAFRGSILARLAGETLFSSPLFFAPPPFLLKPLPSRGPQLVPWKHGMRNFSFTADRNVSRLLFFQKPFFLVPPLSLSRAPQNESTVPFLALSPRRKKNFPSVDSFGIFRLTRD